MIASASSVFVIIPFLLLGTFGYMCLRYRLINKIRPVIDAMHGPYKDKFRFWYGARLFLLVSLAVVNPAYLGGGSQFLKILLQLFLVSAFTIFQAYIKPFSSNWINLLDLWCMLNVISLLFVNLLGLQAVAHSENLLFVNVASMTLTIVIIVGYHIVLFVRKVARRCPCFIKADKSVSEYISERRMNINTYWLQNSFRKGYTDIDNVNDNYRGELTDSERDYSKLREPLLELSSAND